MHKKENEYKIKKKVKEKGERNMKKKIGILCFLILLILPSIVMATSENELLKLQEETNQIMQSIQEQKLDESGINAFIYAIFIVVAISMIFEFFVRGYREEVRRRKQEEIPAKEIRIKLLIVYIIHLFVIGALWLICNYALKFTGIYIWFLIAITVYIVEISPLFTIHFRKRKKEENR